MNQSTLQKCKQIETKALCYAGLDPSEFTLSECPISNSKHIHYVRIHKTPATATNVLVVAHGYFGSLCGYYKMYQLLKNKFHIISFDLPGQGLSSSDDNLTKSAFDWIEYFMERFKKFFDKLELKKFHVMGHSMGAYLLTHFAHKFPEMVDRMILLSPAGVNKLNLKYSQRLKKHYEKIGWFRRTLLKSFRNRVFKGKRSPFNFTGFRIFKGFIVRKYFSARVKIPKNEQEMFVELYSQILDYETSSMECVGYFFNDGPTSDYPIMPILEKLHENKKIVIFYGKRDWMDHRLTRKVIKRKKLCIPVYMLGDCGHQIIYENPGDASRIILEIFGKNKRVLTPKL